MSFCVYSAGSMINVWFAPLYYIDIGLSLGELFLVTAVGTIASLFLMNLWSKWFDLHQSRRPFILLGNYINIGAIFILIFARNIWIVLIYTILMNGRPSSDAFSNALVYKLAEFR